MTKEKIYIKWLIIFFVPFCLFFLPMSETFTMPMRNFLIITAFAILMFIFDVVDIAIASICLMFGYALFGVAPLSTVLSSWTGTIPWMVFGSLVLVNIVQRTTLMKRMAYWCIAKTGGTYAGIIYGLITLGILINLLVPSTLTGIALIGIAYGICQALELGKTKASAGIMIATMMGFLEAGNFIYTPNGIGVLFGIASTITPLPLGYVDFFVQNIVFIPLCYVLGLMTILLMRPEQPIDSKNYFVEQLQTMPPVTKAEKKVMLILISLLLFLLTTSFHGIDMMYGFLIAPFILFFPGFQIGEKADIANVNFGTLIFITACMSIGSAANAVGIGPVFSQTVLPILENANHFVFIGSVWLIIMLGNFLMTPGAEFAVFSPPLVQICLDLGVNPYPVLYTLYEATNNLLFPYESTLWIITFGFGNIYLKDFMKVMGCKMIICLAYLLVLGIPYWLLIGLLS